MSNLVLTCEVTFRKKNQCRISVSDGVKTEVVWIPYEQIGRAVGGLVHKFAKPARKKLMESAPTINNTARAEICPECDGYGTQLQEGTDPTKCGHCGGSGKLSPVA